MIESKRPMEAYGIFDSLGHRRGTPHDPLKLTAAGHAGWKKNWAPRRVLPNKKTGAISDFDPQGGRNGHTRAGPPENFPREKEGANSPPSFCSWAVKWRGNSWPYPFGDVGPPGSFRPSNKLGSPRPSFRCLELRPKLVFSGGSSSLRGKGPASRNNYHGPSTPL